MKTPSQKSPKNTILIRWFENLSIDDIPIAGGKNASLGEMVQALRPHGIGIPDGFALTAEAYRAFLKHNKLNEPIAYHLSNLSQDTDSLRNTSQSIRALFENTQFPKKLQAELLEAYDILSLRYDSKHTDVAVRSSATAEDLPDASFAGQQETFLNVSGPNDLLQATICCFSSIFTERAISYREQKGFEHTAVALSVGVQKMIRSDKGTSGVMFTIDPETGFPDIVVINATYGLGESVVQGTVTPDEFRVFKTCLSDSTLVPILQQKLGSKETQMIYSDANRVQIIDTPLQDRNRYSLNNEQILKLANWAVIIEKHYGRPMDIEWALDGDTNELFIVQARPETVQSQKLCNHIRKSTLTEKPDPPIVKGLAIGSRIASGEVMVLESLADADNFKEGQILVASQTDPDWVPLMKKASAIVTDHGGRTSHAAIVSRELDVPAVIGSGNATEKIATGDHITVNCSCGQVGEVYLGDIAFKEQEISLENLPEINTKMMLNIASPEAAMQWWRLPCDGIGLARMEFIINNAIQVHPMALAKFDELKDPSLQVKIRELITPEKKPCDYFINKLASGIATIAAPHYPNPVIVRMSDFKTNEYAHLLGGEQFEPEEENPMIGFRGASRYYSHIYQPGFALECAAVKKAREQIGLSNIVIMIPFCRTLQEADQVLKVMSEYGLTRGEKGLKIYVMAEIPSNIICAAEFSERFDGFSIGSNDLTQLTLGCDRDSDLLTHIFDERNPAVTRSIAQLIRTAHDNNTPVGICGQAPSDYPEFVKFLVEENIDSISLTPDSLLEARKNVAKAEERNNHA